MEGRPLPPGEHLEPVSGDGSSVFDHLIQLRVIVSRVVVEGDEPLRSGHLGQRDSIRDPAVAPANRLSYSSAVYWAS